MPFRSAHALSELGTGEREAEKLKSDRGQRCLGASGKFHGLGGHGRRRMVMRSLAHVLLRGRPAGEETPQVTDCGYRVGAIVE